MQKYYTTAIRDTDYPLSAPVYLASEVDARMAELEKALEKYGWHDSACDFLLDELECTCGFEAAKRSL